MTSMHEKIKDTVRRSIVWKRLVLFILFAVQISIGAFIVQLQYEEILGKAFMQLQTSAAIQKTLFKDFVESSSDYLDFVAPNFTGSPEQVHELDRHVRTTLVDLIAITDAEGRIKYVSSVIDIKTILKKPLDQTIIESVGFVNAKKLGIKTFSFLPVEGNEDIEGGLFVLFSPYYFDHNSKDFAGVTISVISNKSFASKFRSLKRSGMVMGVDGLIAIVDTTNDKTLFGAISDEAIYPIVNFTSVASKEIKRNLGGNSHEILVRPHHVIFNSAIDNKERIAVSVPFIENKIFIVSQSKKEALGRWSQFAIFIFSVWFLSAIAQWYLVNAIHNHYQKSAQLHEHAFIDALTGLFNRRGFEQIEKKLFAQESRILGFISIDLDDFKLANDVCGHDFGDTILADIAELMNDNIRDSDYAIRFGGDELAVILTEATPEVTQMVSEKIRMAIYDADIEIGDTGKKVSASIGATVIHRMENDFERAIKRADKALYESKAKGKNCISFI